MPWVLESLPLHTSCFHTKFPSHPTKITTIAGANISMHPSLEQKQPSTGCWTWALGPGMPTYTAQVSKQMSSFLVSPWRKEKTSGRAVIALALLRHPQPWLLRIHAHYLCTTTTDTLVKTGHVPSPLHELDSVLTTVWRCLPTKTRWQICTHQLKQRTMRKKTKKLDTILKAHDQKFKIND